MQEVLLKTKGMFDDRKTVIDYDQWNAIAEYMDGEKAIVTPSVAEPKKYVFLGLVDEEKNKELYYMIEQDGMIGRYIDDREGFNDAWKTGEYDPDGCLYLEEKYIERI